MIGPKLSISIFVVIYQAVSSKCMNMCLACELLEERNEDSHHQLWPVLPGHDVLPGILDLHHDTITITASTS